MMLVAVFWRIGDQAKGIDFIYFFQIMLRWCSKVDPTCPYYNNYVSTFITPTRMHCQGKTRRQSRSLVC